MLKNGATAIKQPLRFFRQRLLSNSQKVELNGQDQAAYGVAIIKGLSKRLTANYGKGFTKSYLYSYVRFSKNNKAEIFQTAFGKSLPCYIDLFSTD